MRVEIVGGPNCTGGACSALYYLLKDHLGSASVTLDDAGALVPGGEQRYYPFGESRIDTAALPTDRLFTGQREIADFDIGLYHYNARFYSPSLGRFVSADTVVPGMLNPQAWNRYSYVFNNPILYNDPSGHCPAACPVIIGLAVVAAIAMVAINAENPHMWDPVAAEIDRLVQEMGRKPENRDPPRNKPKLAPNEQAKKFGTAIGGDTTGEITLDLWPKYDCKSPQNKAVCITGVVVAVAIVLTTACVTGHLPICPEDLIPQTVPTHTPTPTPAPTIPPTPTPTFTQTPAPTNTATSTATNTATSTATHTATYTPTNTATMTSTSTATSTATPIVSSPSTIWHMPAPRRYGEVAMI